MTSVDFNLFLFVSTRVSIVSTRIDFVSIGVDFVSTRVDFVFTRVDFVFTGADFDNFFSDLPLRSLWSSKFSW